MFKTIRAFITSYNVEMQQTPIYFAGDDNPQFQQRSPQVTLNCTLQVEDETRYTRELAEGIGYLFLPDEAGYDPAKYEDYVDWAYQIGKDPAKWLTSPDPEKRLFAEKLVKKHKKDGD